MEIQLDPKNEIRPYREGESRSGPSRVGMQPLPPDFDIRKVLAERKRLQERRLIYGQVPITRALPVPRVITLGTTRYTVEELRLGQLATLQGWIDARVGDPLEGLPPEWSDPDPTTRKARLLDLWPKLAGWYPTLATPQGAEHMASPEGRRFFLAVALGSYHPDLTPDDLDAVLAETTPVQWTTLMRVLYAIPAKVELLAELVPDDEQAPANWPKNIVTVIREYRLSFDQVAALTLSQWRLLCSDGDVPERTEAVGTRSRRVPKPSNPGASPA